MERQVRYDERTESAPADSPHNLARLLASIVRVSYLSCVAMFWQRLSLHRHELNDVLEYMCVDIRASMTAWISTFERFADDQGFR